ncbi:MAG: NADH-quinone oxidoreductase subunit K [Candidatus Aenigmarchaeota archaeon]|nr:NADH-quinone oxidoreductase subunit K [Candidatus Aenigmarchaeota archaeon]
MIAETYLAIVVLMVLGIYCIVWKSNLVKKIIGLGIFAKAIHLLLITIGFRPGGIAPIVTPQNLQTFASLSVDPLPQALVLTSIVIDLSVTALALSIAILAWRHFRTLNTDKIRRMRG